MNKIRELKQELIKRAIKQHGVENIEKLHAKSSFTTEEEGGRIFLTYWFNDKRTHSTKIVRIKVPKVQISACSTIFDDLFLLD